VGTVYHEVYHHDQQLRFYDRMEEEAEEYGRRMYGIFARRMRDFR